MAAQPPQAKKKNILQEFRDFLNQGDFVTIAVGLVIALYFQKIVDAILNGVIFPIIAAIFGKPDFQDIGFDIGKSRISIGLVINAAVSFIVVAALLFLILKAYNRMRATKTGEEADTELSVLREIRDSMRAGGRGPV
jgi:large conductance mechanosensitive channel